jgi:hypothetical protein
MIASTLTVYDGRTALAHTEIKCVGKGCAEYRARLAAGRKLVRFETQKALAAIDVP